MKDNFSQQAALYASYRPVYPPALYDFILPLVESKKAAWDCGTGNGQVAAVLSEQFTTVYATDISATQLSYAVKKSNIIYSVEAAEYSSLQDNSLDLITVAQAIHWFGFDAFYKQVKRTLKPGGLFVLMGYGLLTINPKADSVINHFYKEIIYSYWDKERHYIDENYRTIPFPFTEIATPAFIIQFEWTLEELTGYLNTWSAVQHYIKANHKNPVHIIYPQLAPLFKAQEKLRGYFPVLLRAAYV